MTLDENLGDLERHRSEFEARTAFAYTVLEPADDAVIGCVYINPGSTATDDAVVRTWVRASHAELDTELRETVVAWLERDWPFSSVTCPAE